jgi:hypothetical protein
MKKELLYNNKDIRSLYFKDSIEIWEIKLRNHWKAMP